MKKIKVTKTGLRKKTTMALWTVLTISVLFGVYKNFTAIDQHTTHEEKIIETKIVDTNFISSYVEEFAQIFYSWEPKKELLENRTEELKNYLPDELQKLNQEMVRSDIPTKSTVEKVKIWKVEQVDTHNYKVLFSVKQLIEEKQNDVAKKNTVNSVFSLTVRTNDKNNLVISTNPAMAALPKKLEVKEKILQDDLSIEAKTKKDILEFLNTFFTAYPTAKKTELLYYCDISNIEEINKAYVFSEIKNINYFEADQAVNVHLTLSYLDKETKATIHSIYDLVLEERDSKWIIVSGL